MTDYDGFLCPEVKNADGSPLLCQGEHCRFFTKEHGCIKAKWLEMQVRQIEFFLKNGVELDDCEYQLPPLRQPKIEERRELV